MNCAAAELADRSCPVRARLLAFHMLTRIYIRNGQAQDARNGSRRGVTASLVLSVLAVSALYLWPAKLVLAALCAVYVGTCALAVRVLGAGLPAAPRAALSDGRLAPDHEGMPMDRIVRAARGARVMSGRPPPPPPLG